MTREVIVGGVIAVALASAQVVPVGGQSRDEPGAAQAPHQEHEQHGDGTSTVQAQEHRMMQMRQEMMADMTAMDATLNELVAAMHSATGEAKVTALAEVVSALAQQRMTMRDRMMHMQGRMMGHMMEHMAQGMSAEARAAMAACPMMGHMAGPDHD